MMGGTFKRDDQAHVFDQGKIINCVVVAVADNDGIITVTLDSAYGIRYTLPAAQVGRGWLAVGSGGHE